MNILILNELNLDYAPYHDWFKGQFDALYLLSTTNTIDCIHKADEDILQYYEKVKFFEDYSENGEVDYVAMQWLEKYKIDKIIALGEFDLIRAAKLREHYGIAGQNVQSALAYRDKVVMKQYIENTDVALPNYHEVDYGTDLLIGINAIGLPCILKTRSGGGSMGISVLKAHNDVRKALRERFKTQERANLILEAFVECNVYHVDGVVENGEIRSIWPSMYVNSCLSYQQGKAVCSYTLSVSNPLVDILKLATKKVIEALPSPENFAFHAEFFVNDAQEVTFCEIASRVAGGGINESYTHALGVNLEKCFALGQLGALLVEDFGWQSPRHGLYGSLLIPQNSGVLTRAPKYCPLDYVVEFELSAKVGQVLGAAQSSASRLARFAFKGADEEDILANMLRILPWFNEQTQWLTKVE
ncbi:ATP-grasp domain-containing protein [Pseudoalteromonas sp. ASV78]|uniref:ATP-grasp domain-containing protein n=1 Tax=Pseudoalteromonas sp. ASV78 TaxID=3397851 RepID=UPI0039FB9E14